MREQALPPPARLGILLNPLSGRVKRCLPRLRALAASVPGASMYEASRPEAVAHAVQRWQADGLDVLVIMGGDGTLQAALTALLHEPTRPLPALLVVPGGTTNMSAADLGARLKPEPALKALAAWAHGRGNAPRSILRPALRVEGSSLQFGLFFGTGAILTGVRYFHQHVRPTGVRGALGPALTFIRLLLSLLRNKPHPLLPASPAALQGDGHQWQNDWLLVLASTLDTLLIGCRPYWGREMAPMHFTAVVHQPRRLMRVLPFLLSGRGARRAHERDGYISRNLTTLDMHGTHHFILDGEQFETTVPIRLSTTAPLRFLTY
ncbi:diacylglycerol kinase-like protein [Pseudomonas duriflava]|uniref:Diacylglycerol kinase-like protein n=1 Tax=Pseudomonas duriflava TaxID=459528 RepID=A0A562QKJ8_9PSED|nr:acylglycerol kinase family protein [Pseudomonas duriflava]TWI56720.1 diacylglycerol kinase-like protein [Pseudomonas duriflava]